MGTFTKGILGGFSGKVGSVIGGSWKGIDYMRSRPPRRTGDPTEAQLKQQLKFSLVVKFLQAVFGFVNIGFANYAVKMSGFNSAMSYNLKNAITGTFPNFELDYSLVLLSRGDLPAAGNPNAVSDVLGTVQFTWSNNTGVGKAKASDKAMLMVFCPIRQQAIYTTGSLTRADASETLQVPEFTGETVETYISFISADGKDVSTSIYTGHLVVSSVM